MSKLIDLWKTGCEDCEAALSIIAELEKKGFEFEKYNIETPQGQDVWEKYLSEIDEYSKNRGWETGYIYTPTFINPKNRKVAAFADRPPTKEELINLAESGY